MYRDINTVKRETKIKISRKTYKPSKQIYEDSNNTKIQKGETDK